MGGAGALNSERSHSNGTSRKTLHGTRVVSEPPACTDLRATGNAARVIDWKTGDPPKRVPPLGGLKLQRVVCAAAARRTLTTISGLRAVIAHVGPDVALQGLNGEALERCRSTLKERLRRHGSAAGGLCGARDASMSARRVLAYPLS